MHKKSLESGSTQRHCFVAPPHMFMYLKNLRNDFVYKYFFSIIIIRRVLFLVKIRMATMQLEQHLHLCQRSLFPNAHNAHQS